MGRSLSGLCLAVTAAFIAIPGCLNPRPEELPSTLDTEPVVADPNSGPARETCSDNPYLAGCAVPDQGAGNAAGSAPEESPRPGARGFDGVDDAGDGTPADAGAPPDPEASSSSDAGP